MGLKLSYNMQVSADIQYFAVSNRVYFLSNNVGIHFVFTYYFPTHPFRLVPMFSGIAPLNIVSSLFHTSLYIQIHTLTNRGRDRMVVKFRPTYSISAYDY